MSWTLERKVATGFTVALTILLIVGILSLRTNQQLMDTADWVAHTHRVLARIENMALRWAEAESARRGIVLSGDTSLVNSYGTATAGLRQAYVDLKRLTADNPRQQNRLNVIHPVLERKLAQLDSSVVLWHNEGAAGMPEQVRITSEGTKFNQKLHPLLDEMRNEEQSLLAERDNQLKRSRLLLYAVVTSGTGVALSTVAIAFALIRRDMKLRRRAEALLAASNADLQDFGYTVSHDLKAPLRGIAGYSQELDRKHSAALNERGRFCISQILSAARGMDSMVEDLLRYSRLAGENPMRSPVEVNNLIRNVLKPFDRTIQEQKAEVSADVPFDTLVCWERGLTQALTNLVDNAIKYSRNSNPPRVQIKGTQTHRAWELSVTDNGIGFDMKQHDRMFKLFSRLVRPEEFSGTGAGLAITKKLVEKQGGRVWATSEPGKGASFFIEIPKPGGSILAGTTS